VCAANVSAERKHISPPTARRSYGPTGGRIGRRHPHRPCPAEAEPESYLYADQYGNEQNWKAHYRTTANEIWKQTEGQVTHFVAGLGTSGTFMAPPAG